MSEKSEQGYQWILDYIIGKSGQMSHWEVEGVTKVPPEVRSWRMVPKVMAKLAQRQEEVGRKAEQQGHFQTAWEAYQSASVSYGIAQHVICEDDNAEKIRLYQKMLYCYGKVIEHNEYPIEKLEIPWGDKTIPALLHLLPDKRKAPCVLYIPGMDQTKEGFLGTYGIPASPNPFIQRGMHVLSMDGPGQGESNLKKIRATPDNYEKAGKAAIDYLISRPEIDKEKIAAYGVSMGSYWGSRLAAYDKRVKACAVTLGCFFMEKHPLFEEGSPRFRMTFKYMAGIPNDDEFDKMVAQMTLKGIGKEIKCPILLTTGEFDPVSLLEETYAFFDEIAGPKELWVFEDEFHPTPSRGLAGLNRHSVVADWLKDKLNGKYDKQMGRKVLIPIKSIGPYSGIT